MAPPDRRPTSAGERLRVRRPARTERPHRWPRRPRHGVAELAHVVEVGVGEQLAVDGEVALDAQLLELLQRPFEGPPAGAGELVELPLHAVEVALHLLGRLGVLLPLLAELADQLQDLVAGLLDHEVVERLADDAEEGEQRQRRAHHDPLAHRLVEQAGVVLVDEAGELLVGQEQQHVVDGRPVALAGVVPLGQLLDPQPDVGEEALEVRLALGVGADLEVAQVRRQRELDVHVQHVALGQVEREVGPAGAALDLGLLAVVDVLGEPGQAQHVLGHPLAPLAAGLRVGQRLAQHPRRVGERAGDLGVGAQRLVDLAEALGARRAELGDQRAEALQLGAHLDAHLVEAGVDDVLLRRQVGLHALVTVLAAEPSCSRLSTAACSSAAPHGGVALGADARAASSAMAASMAS